MCYLGNKEQRELYRKKRVEYQREYRKLYPQKPRTELLQVMNFREKILKQEWENFVGGTLKEYPNISLKELRSMLKAKNLIFGKNAVKRRLMTMGIWDRFKKETNFNRAVELAFSPNDVKEELKSKVMAVLNKEENTTIKKLYEQIDNAVCYRTFKRQINEMEQANLVETKRSFWGFRGSTTFIRRVKNGIHN